MTSRCLSKNCRGCCIGHGRGRARCQWHRDGCVTKMRLCWGICMSSWRSLLLLALLLSALAPAVAVAELSCPTALVLLRHPPFGLRWLERRWAAATDPLSVEYRRFSAAAEIMSHLSPPPAEVAAAESWVEAHGWRVGKRYGDAIRVAGPCASGDRARLESQTGESLFTATRAPAVVASVMPTGAAHAAWQWQDLRAVRRSPSTAAERRLLSPHPAIPPVRPPLACDAQCMRNLYSIPPIQSSASVDAVRVATWQGAKCRVWPADMSQFCNMSSLGGKANKARSFLSLLS
eukprot:COSAG06_NODE_166_length_21548_cov_13.568651_6_plen_290_part_00